VFFTDFQKILNIKFHENASNGSRVVPCGQTDGQADRQTDMTKLIVTFRNFVNAPKKVSGKTLQYLNRKHFRCLQFLSLVLCDFFFFKIFTQGTNIFDYLKLWSVNQHVPALHGQRIIHVMQ